ncbi:MAG: benzoyl-CoA-dihydrodiol lyase [Pseudohongiellaceae bacterium]|jgi:benzoyl-CoA-dihydrodiol lyase
MILRFPAGTSSVLHGIHCPHRHRALAVHWPGPLLEIKLSATETPQTAVSETERLDFDRRPTDFIHWKLNVEGDIATLAMDVQEDQGLKDHYVLKLNSYDLSVDMELAAAIQYLRFSHPEVRCLVLTGNLDRVFCAGANIIMLRTSTHAFKVNFCKFTNETRLYLEEASANSGLKTLAALNGTASGGGYELALACDRILLVDDRNSAVSHPEVPLLGVLPGTGGLTRMVDKRKIRRDLADVFNTTAEGVKGKRAVTWNLVDAVAPLSKFGDAVTTNARELADASPALDAGQGLDLERMQPQFTDSGFHYQSVDVAVDNSARKAAITITLPEAAGPSNADEAFAAGSDWWIFRTFRELDDALLHLRLEYLDVGLLTLRVVGDPQVVLDTDVVLESGREHWFVREVSLLIKRALKRLDVMSRSVYAIVDEGTAFAGTMLELALAGDRVYLLNDPDVPVTMGVSAMNGGAYPMGNGLSRLESHFYGTPDQVGVVLEHKGLFDSETADDLGLATVAPDDLDWEDDLRIALEERVSFSPDGLTGLEANLRFCGPETMETKIFGRLSAWQNWIFQRPNAVGERGALKCYGTPNRPEFDWSRT